MTKSDMVDLHLKVPRPLLASFDAAIVGRYTTRNEAVRDFMRRFIEDKGGPS